MSDKPESGAKLKPERKERWEAFMEYRKRVRAHAWLLAVGVPAAFLASEKVDLDVAWLGNGKWLAAAVCAIIAQAALLLLTMQSLVLLIGYREPWFPKPKTEKEANVLLTVVNVSVGLIVLAEFVVFLFIAINSFLQQKQCILWLVVAAGAVPWAAFWGCLFHRMTGWPCKRQADSSSGW